MFVRIFQSELRWTDSLNFFWPFQLNNTHLGLVWTIPYLHNLSVNFVYRPQLKMMTSKAILWTMLPHGRLQVVQAWMLTRTSYYPFLLARGVWWEGEKRGSVLSLPITPSSRRALHAKSNSFFFLRKYNIFVFQKFFLHYSNGLFIENVNVIKHWWNRDELFVPCHQQNKGESD